MAEEVKIAEEVQGTETANEQAKEQVEAYVHRMINEVVDLSTKIGKLDQFINQHLNELDKVEFGHVMVQLAGMVQYRNGLNSRLQMRGISIDQNGNAYRTHNVQIDTTPVEENTEVKDTKDE